MPVPRSAPLRFARALRCLGGGFVLFLVAGAPRTVAAEARGLVIYKERAFQADTSAVLMEYRSQTTHGAVLYFLTIPGRRVAVPTGKAEAIFLPYPGTGQVTPEEALTILTTARQRFPQFIHHYRLYEHVWKAEARRSKEDIAREIAARQAQEAQAQGISAFLRSQAPVRPPPTPPANLLKPTPTPEAARSGQGTLEENLETVRQLYRELE
jgi:hypothetical protein